MLDLEQLRHRVEQDERVQALYIFGSVAAGTSRPSSDIDIAVLLTNRVTLADELRLRAIAVETLHRDDIDFVILNHAPPLLRYEVISQGTRLFARDDAAVDAFEHRSIMMYLDTEHLRRMEHDLLREAAQ